MMTARGLVLALAAGFVPGCADDAGVGETAQAVTDLVPTVGFSDVHINAKSWGGAGCGGFTRHLWGQEPAAAGRYPVFVYFVGYIGVYTAVDAQRIVTEMAGRGFVAASVEYTSGLLDGLDCATTQNKASCAFSPTTTTSALYKLCHRAKADCSKGVVAAGISLGGAVVLLARNYNPNVQAVWTMATGTGNDTASCVEPPYRALPPSRHLALSGQADVTIGPVDLNAVTGLSCPTTSTECPYTDGASFPTAGWYQVQNAQVADGAADHCYQLSGGCSGTTLEANWAPPSSYAWSLGPTLDWLKTFVSP
jgi:hypothetical protein